MSKARGLADLGNVYDDGALSNRNLIINGAMNVAQRGTSVSGIENGQGRTCDRIGFYTNTGTWTVSQESDGPSGFSNSFKVLATATESADTADQSQIFYSFEGQDLQGVAKGTSDAKELTLSFWCKANKAETISIALRDLDNSRLCVKYVTINAVDTWEYKTVLIPADTTGTFDNDNVGSLTLELWLKGGSNYTGGTPTGSWEAYSADIRMGDGSTSTLGNTANDYFQITGYQLEVGDTATPFEHRSYGDELARCQRYYEKSYDQSVSPGSSGSYAGSLSRTANGTNYQSFFIQFKQNKRSTPTMTFYNPQTGASGQIRDATTGGSPTVSGLAYGASQSSCTNVDATYVNDRIYFLQYTAEAEL